MKKLVSLLLVLVMVCSFSMAMAETVVVAPGDPLSFDVEISGASGMGARIGLETNDAPVTFDKAIGGSVNDTVPPKAFNDYFVVVNLDGIDLLEDGSNWSGDLTAKYPVLQLANGHIGTVNFTVDTDAEEGTYTVEAVKKEGSCTVTGSITFEVKKPVTGMKGDVDEDGDVDLIDVMLTSTYVYVDPNDINTYNADMDDDGEITLMDIMAIARIVYPS